MYKFSKQINNLEELLAICEQVATKDVSFTIPDHLFWVLAKTKVKFINRINTDFLVDTFAVETKKFSFDREYHFIDSSVKIAAISKWLVIDKNTKRIAKVDMPNLTGESLLEPFEKIDFSDDFLLLKTHLVTDSNLDLNNHVNNAKYTSFFAEYIDYHNLAEFQIEYLKEVFLNEEIKIYKHNIKNIIIGKVNEVTVFKASFKLKDNDRN